MEVRFHVPSDLVGLAIGREGANVNEARRFDGIISIEFEDYSSMFSVKGEVGCHNDVYTVCSVLKM